MAATLTLCNKEAGLLSVLMAQKQKRKCPPRLRKFNSQACGRQTKKTSQATGPRARTGKALGKIPLMHYVLQCFIKLIGKTDTFPVQVVWVVIVVLCTPEINLKYQWLTKLFKIGNRTKEFLSAY